MNGIGGKEVMPLEERMTALERKVDKLEALLKATQSAEAEFKQDIKSLERTMGEMREEMARLSQQMQNFLATLEGTSNVVERIAAVETKITMLQWFVPILIAVIEFISRLWR